MVDDAQHTMDEVTEALTGPLVEKAHMGKDKGENRQDRSSRSQQISVREEIITEGTRSERKANCSSGATREPAASRGNKTSADSVRRRIGSDSTVNSPAGNSPEDKQKVEKQDQ